MYNGIIEDKRDRKDKVRDFQAKELLVSSIPTFRVVSHINYAKQGKIRSQNGSGSCVCQALAKAIEMSMVSQGLETNEIELVASSLFPYQNRSNKPQSGSSPVEMCQFTRDHNWYLEKDVASQNMNDSFMDNFKIESTILKKKGYSLFYFTDPTPEFEEVAQYVEQYGNAMMLIDSDALGYVKDIPTPNKRNHEIRHEVCVVDNITLNGVKYLVMDESWGITGDSDIARRGQRLITKEAFYKMVEQVIVIRIIKNKEVGQIDYTKYQGIKKANFGDRNLNVLLIQDMLKDGGYLDKDIETVNYDKYGKKYGFYGTITAYAVLKWQLDNIKTVSEKQLRLWGGKYFGNSSLNIIKINTGTPVSTSMKNFTFRWDKFLTIMGSSLLMFLSVNIASISWTKAGLMSAGIAAIQFIIQAIVKYYSIQE